MTYKSILALSISSMALVGCALTPMSAMKVTHSFSDRAIEINQAYGDAAAAQILKNVLRARDRQPRSYTALSELKITPLATQSHKAEATSLGLGNPGNAMNLNPWVTLGGSSTIGSTSTLELTVSADGT